MNVTTQTAAVVVLGLASMAAAKVTYDDVIKAADAVKTCQFKQIISSKDHPGVTSQYFWKESGVTRIEYPNGTIWLDARAQNKSLFINPSQKTVVIFVPKKGRAYQMEKSESSVLAGRLRGWKKLFDKQEYLGEKTIDGRKAVGCRLSGESHTLTLWVDPETKLPIKEELLGHNGSPFGQDKSEYKAVSFDYVYNPKLDDSLFSLTPPKGYKVEKREVIMSLPMEEDLLQGLKVIAQANQNQFPDELTMKFLARFTTRENEEQIMYMLNFATMQYREKHDWRYMGRGVKLGQKDKPVYWYQPAANKPYRVVYGDLSVRDIPKDKLPTTQPATQPTTQPSAEAMQGGSS